MKLPIMFILITILNIVSGTIKTRATVKAKPMVAGIISACNYTINAIAVKAVSDADMANIILVTFIANIICVPVTKWFLDIIRKERLWVFDITIKCSQEEIDCIRDQLKTLDIGSVYEVAVLDKIYTMKAFCDTKKQSAFAKKILRNYVANYYIIEPR